MNKNIFICIICSFLLASCSTQKEQLTYFEGLGTQQTTGVIDGGSYEVKIIPDDELVITITSVVPEATAQYNVTPMAIARRSEATESKQQQSFLTYVVDKNGEIMLPVIGKIKAAGLTTSQLCSAIKAEVEKTVKDPYVRVQLANFRINVLGEVSTPGAIQVTNERYTILDALADAGDLTPYGKRENVLLIREENGQHIYHRINLNDTEILSSPYFYLQQNDVIYVEPNEIKKANSRYNQDNGYKLSVISTVVSAVSVIASLTIALFSK
jgi:polysaccharide export outer membrane protein